MVEIRDFAQRLAGIADDAFTREGILQFLREYRVDPASLEPYLYFSQEHYTRHLIHRTSLFELLAICWESGQKSAIHNHRDQRCWMATAFGKVQVHNFKLIRKDPSAGFCELQSDTNFLITPESPQEV